MYAPSYIDNSNTIHNIVCRCEECRVKLYSEANNSDIESVVDFTLPLAKVNMLFKEHPNNMHFKYGAFIMRRKEIISIGWNQKKTHPKQLEYQTNTFKVFLHAEIHAIIRARQSVVDCDMYIFRQVKSGKLATSTPCNGCVEAMRDAGLNNVTFYKNDHFVKMKL